MLEQAYKIDARAATRDVAADPSSDIVIRAARDRDADGLVSLIRSIYEEYPGCIFDLENEQPELKRPASYFSRAKGRLWVAESHGQVIASLGFLPAEEPAGIELQKVYLRRDQRGSDLARRMFEIALAAARADGARFIELWANTRFQAAHRFYEKLGFVRSRGERLLDDLSRSSEYHYLLRLAPG